MIYTDTLGRTVNVGDTVICFTASGRYVRRFYGTRFAMLSGRLVDVGVTELCFVILSGEEVQRCETIKVVERAESRGKAPTGSRGKRSRRRKRAKNISRNGAKYTARSGATTPTIYSDAHASQHPGRLPSWRNSWKFATEIRT